MKKYLILHHDPYLKTDTLIVVDQQEIIRDACSEGLVGRMYPLASTLIVEKLELPDEGLDG